MTRLGLCFMLLASIASCFGGQGALADTAPETVVYLECTTTAGVTSRGSGVLVSAKGHVLTAKHVAQPGSTCKGTIGVADGNIAQLMVVQPTNLPVDAALLRFSKPGEYPFVKYCPIEDWMVRSDIVVAGFPGRTETGAVSYRKGVLSTVTPNAAGVLETDGQTTEGMSGGPVYSPQLEGLVGIVAGAGFANDATVSFYGIVPVSFYADALNLTPLDVPCYHESRAVTLAHDTWRAGDPAIALDLSAREGICFISEVFGEFNAAEDRVFITIRDGQYMLDGINRSGGVHGGRASCVRYN